jgi:hypothetical protein
MGKSMVGAFGSSCCKSFHPPTPMPATATPSAARINGSDWPLALGDRAVSGAAVQGAACCEGRGALTGLAISG